MVARRGILIALGAAALTAPLNATAQQPKKTYRIGYLGGGGLTGQQEAFRERLRELGYAEGRNLVIDWRSTQGRADDAPKLAKELVGLNVDCIVANGVAPVRAAKQATTSIPIVMSNVDADPVELGFIASLARPGGNVTGFTGIAHDLAGKRLELLRELVPNAKRVGMLVAAPIGDAQKAHYRGTESLARMLGIEVRMFPPRSPEELEKLIPANAEWRPQILSVFSGSWFGYHRARIVDWVAKMKLPAIYSNAENVELGGLMSYSDDGVERHREAAGYVAKILSGVRPADLAVQHPTKFYLAINLKTAKALSITIPHSILLRADRVIE